MSQTQLRSSLTNALSQRSSHQKVFCRITLTFCSALSPGQPDFFLTTALESPKLNHLMAQMVKNLLAMQETWVGSLCREDPLEKGMAIHSILA